ncbi:uncharacterized protein [Argopecten irradians]|uniref:uncharacterized protein n=1 Tax=Argopecten irradians TaxID=31199 RepID=UPI003719B48F
MTKRKDGVYILVLAVAWLIYLTGASDDTVTVDGTACGQSYSIDHGDSLDVKWTGTDLPANCSVGFSAPDNKSTICMQVEQFIIYQCVFEIQVKHKNKTYDCNTTVIGEEYCISSQQTVYLDFIYSYKRAPSPLVKRLQSWWKSMRRRKKIRVLMGCFLFS